MVLQIKKPQTAESAGAFEPTCRPAPREERGGIAVGEIVVTHAVIMEVVDSDPF